MRKLKSLEKKIDYFKNKINQYEIEKTGYALLLKTKNIHKQKRTNLRSKYKHSQVNFDFFKKKYHQASDNWASTQQEGCIRVSRPVR